MSHWTTLELRRLDEAYQEHRASGQELVKMFPRHSIGSILRVASRRGLCKRHLHRNWLMIAHLYFARREAELGRRAG